MSTNIERNVMASVAVIYTTRKFLSPLALQFYALIVSAVGIAMFVSVPNVAQNFQAVAASGGFDSISTFLFSAVISTTIVVKLWLVVGSAAVISLFLRVARSFTTARAALA